MLAINFSLIPRSVCLGMRLPCAKGSNHFGYCRHDCKQGWEIWCLTVIQRTKINGSYILSWSFWSALKRKVDHLDQCLQRRATSWSQLITDDHRLITDDHSWSQMITVDHRWSLGSVFAKVSCRWCNRLITDDHRWSLGSVFAKASCRWCNRWLDYPSCTFLDGLNKR